MRPRDDSNAHQGRGGYTSLPPSTLSVVPTPFHHPLSAPCGPRPSRPSANPSSDFLSIFLSFPLPLSFFVCPPRTTSRTPRDTRCMSGLPLPPTLSLSLLLRVFVCPVHSTQTAGAGDTYRGKRPKNPQKRERERERHKGRAHALKGNDASTGGGGFGRVVVADSPSLTLENSPCHATFFTPRGTRRPRRRLGTRRDGPAC